MIQKLVCRYLRRRSLLLRFFETGSFCVVLSVVGIAVLPAVIVEYLQAVVLISHLLGWRPR